MFDLSMSENGEGRVHCGDWSEAFLVDEESLESEHVGNDAWVERVRQFTSDGQVSCFLFTARYPHRSSNFWRAWVLFRQDDGIFLTEQLCIFDWVLKLLIATGFADEERVENILKRRFERDLPLPEEVSKWTVKQSDLTAFVSTASPN